MSAHIEWYSDRKETKRKKNRPHKGAKQKVPPVREVPANDVRLLKMVLRLPKTLAELRFNSGYKNDRRFSLRYDGCIPMGSLALSTEPFTGPLRVMVDLHV